MNKQYRMIYEIHDTEVFVSVISLRSHYGEKRALSSRKTVASYITFRLCLHG